MKPEASSRVKVDIMGQEYVLKGSDAPDYLEMLARFVNNKMELIRQAHPSYPPTKVAVLTSLQIADELNKLREDYEKIIRELQS